MLATKTRIVNHAAAYVHDWIVKLLNSVERSILIAGASMVHQTYLATLTGPCSRIFVNGWIDTGAWLNSAMRSTVYATSGIETATRTFIVDRRRCAAGLHQTTASVAIIGATIPAT